MQQAVHCQLSIDLVTHFSFFGITVMVVTDGLGEGLGLVQQWGGGTGGKAGG